MRTRAFCGLVAVLASALPAAAFELTGATLTFDIRNPDDAGNETQQHATGGLEFAFGAGLGLQFSVKNTNYDYDGFPAFGSFGHELHLIWRPQAAEGLALGAFYGEEDFDPWYHYAGIEAKYEAAAFTFEGAVLDYSGPGYDARHVIGEIGYQVSDRFSVYGGMANYNAETTSDARHTYLGSSFGLGNGFSLYGEYGRNDYDVAADYNVVTLGLRYDFGSGVTFQQRSYTEFLPND